MFLLCIYSHRNRCDRRAHSAYTVDGRNYGRNRRSHSRPPASASAATAMRAKTLPPAWEPGVLVEADDATVAAEAERRSRTWNKEDERALRERIRGTIGKINDISGGLQDSGDNGEAGGHGDGGNGGRGGANGAGSCPTSQGRRKKANQAGAAASQAGSSIKSLHESLKISLELVATGEKHASANTTTIADMSEWLSNLEQKQLVGTQRRLKRVHSSTPECVGASIAHRVKNAIKYLKGVAGDSKLGLV